MKKEEGRRVAAVKAFELVEKKSQDLNAKLIEADQDKKSAKAAVDVGRGGQRLSASSSAKPRMISPLPKSKQSPNEEVRGGRKG